MKARLHNGIETGRARRILLVSVALVAWVGAGCGGGDSPPTEAKPKKAPVQQAASVDEPAEGETNEVATVWPVFEDVPGKGKDPFFPNSERRQKAVEPDEETGPSVSGGVVANLIVKTIIRASTPRAWINNRSFVEGEEGVVRLQDGNRVMVECLEIAAEVVIVNIKDTQGRMVLERAHLPLRLTRQLK